MVKVGHSRESHTSHHILLILQESHNILSFVILLIILVKVESSSIPTEEGYWRDHDEDLCVTLNKLWQNILHLEEDLASKEEDD